jgi:conjugal transfer ATP-binding protein TraC
MGIQKIIMITNLKNKISKNINFFDDNSHIPKSSLIKLPNSFSELLPYRSYNKDNKLYYNFLECQESIKQSEESCGFVIKATPIIGCSESDIDILATFFNDNLPEDLILQIMLYASPNIGDNLDRWAEFRSKEGGIYDELSKKRMNFINKGRWDSLFSAPYVSRNFELYISASLKKKNKDDDVEEKLIRLKKEFISNLGNVNISTKNLEPDELISLLNEILNPKPENTHRERIEWDELDPINHQISNSESKFNINTSCVELANDIVAMSHTINKYPKIWFGWEMINLLGSENRNNLRISCPFIFNMILKVPKNSKSLQKAIIKSATLNSRAESRSAKFWKNIGQMAGDWNYAKEHVEAGQKLVEVKYNIVLLAKRNVIDDESEKLKSIFTANKWKISKDNYSHLPSFLSTLPFYINESRFTEFERLAKVKSLITWNCTNIAPLQAEYRGAVNDPCLMLFGKRGQPLFWNPYYCEDGGNYNTVITGKSGSGKSVFIQDLAASIRGIGGTVFVIDNGESFRNSGKLQEASIIKVNKKTSINPFTMFDWNNVLIDKDYQTDIVNFFSCLVSQIVRPINPINEDEIAIINMAVKKSMEMGRKGTLKIIKDNLLKVVSNEKQKELAESLTLSFNVFLDKYGDYFEGESSVVMDSKMMIFEMSNLEGHGQEDLKAVIMMNIMFLITQLVYKSDRSTRMALIIDEAWTMLQGGSMKNFIEGFVRRVRKFGGSLITASQSINDFYTNPGAKAVLDNSQHKIFLAQNPDAVDFLKNNDILAMNKKLTEALKSLRMVSGCYAECLIYSGDASFHVGRLILDPFSIFLYSSKAEEVNHIEKLKSQGLSVSQAINKIIGEKNDY